MSSVTAVIPVYNDVNALKRAIPESVEALAAFGRPFELIIAEDESTDGTRAVAEEWEKKRPAGPPSSLGQTAGARDCAEPGSCNCQRRHLLLL